MASIAVDPTSGDRLGRAVANARSIRTNIGTEVRTARLGAGLSQSAAGGAVHMSAAQFGRIERAELRTLTVEQASRACAAVGLRLVARPYPDGDPVRDRAQLAILERFRSVLPAGARLRTEVPLAIPGDLRAWDGALVFRDGPAKVEAESKLTDLQAVDRRIAPKQRDDGVDLVILRVNDTPANRRALRLHRDALRGRFPLDGRDVLGAVRQGRLPRSSGVLVI